MSRQRLNASQIRAGVPLPFDTYDESGRLLLSRGFVIESEEQAIRLIERGMYSGGPDGGNDAAGDGADAAARAILWSAASTAPPRIRISVHDLLDEAHAVLTRTLATPPDDGSFPDAVSEIAHRIQRGCELDPDAALARNMVVRRKPHAIRHCLDTAILVELMLRQTQPDPERRLPVICAALTMNLSALALHEWQYHHPEAPDLARAEQLRNHPETTALRLAALGVRDPLWLGVVRQHHEAADGSGYPGGLKLDALRPESQLVAAADQYCSDTSERAWRAGKPPGLALQDLLVRMGTQLDARAASRLIREVGIYPPGALVTLASGEIAMVVCRTLNARQPVVRSLTDAHGKPRAEPAKRMTSDARFAVKGIPQGRSSLSMPIRLEQMWYPVVVDESAHAEPAG